MALPPGTQLGPYEILGIAGAGGMGEVYRARDTRLGRTVAIKVLPEEIQSDADRRRRFRSEAQAIAAMNHPHICALHDVSREADVDFLVMEYVEGETLERRLKRGSLPLDDALEIGVEIGDALAAAHRGGVVHRDLKPANVMLTRTGAKLLDFGLAKRGPGPGGESASPQSTTATMHGAFVGTLPYMAPEQVEGHAIDARTDIFAFGALLYEMIAGRRAFPGETQAAVVAAILGPPPPAPSQVRFEIPRSLDRIIATCLARDPDSRWQGIMDVLHELRWVAMDLKSGETGVGSRRRPSRWWLHAAWGAAVVAIAMSSLLLPRGATRSTPPPPNPHPVIVLMDSPLPDRVYDPRTAADGGTNADDITDALRDLDAVIHKENTSAMWHREEQVLSENPDLIVSHLSCLLDERFADGREESYEHLFSLAENRLIQFFGYIGASNPRTRVLVYSRGAFVDSVAAEQWIKNAEARFPVLRGRLHTFSVPGDQGGAASFRNPNTARLMLEQVQQVLGAAPPASSDRR